VVNGTPVLEADDDQFGALGLSRKNPARALAVARRGQADGVLAVGEYRSQRRFQVAARQGLSAMPTAQRAVDDLAYDGGLG